MFFRHHQDSDPSASGSDAEAHKHKKKKKKKKKRAKRSESCDEPPEPHVPKPAQEEADSTRERRETSSEACPKRGRQPQDGATAACWKSKCVESITVACCKSECVESMATACWKTECVEGTTAACWKPECLEGSDRGGGCFSTDPHDGKRLKGNTPRVKRGRGGEECQWKQLYPHPPRLHLLQ